MNFRNSSGLAVAIGLALPATVALAADENAPDHDAEDRDARAQEEVVVFGQERSYANDSSNTATKLDLSLRETPQSLTVISRQQLEDFALDTVADAMKRTPGVNVYTQDTERLRFSARGFDINQFLYDGLPSTRANSLASQTAHIDPIIYERIEVLKGASGLLNGIGNPSATINLVRKKPTEEPQGDVTVGADSWNAYRTEFDVGGAVNSSGSMRGRFVGAHEQGESFLDHYEKTKSMVYGVAEFDIGTDTMLTVGADSLDYDPEGSTWGALPLYYSDGSETNFPASLNPATEWSSWAQEAQTAFVELDHRFGNAWTARLAYTDEHNSYDAQLSSAGSGFPDPETGAGMSLWAGRYSEQRTQDTLDVYALGVVELFGREHELIVGATHSSGERYYTGRGVDPSFDYTVPSLMAWQGDRAKPEWAPINTEENETIDQSGFYVTARFNATDALSVIAGGRRVSWERDLDAESDWAGITQETYDEDEPVPFLGIVYDVGTNHSVYASYTSIFKPQTLRNRNNEILEPEEGLSYELGFKSELKEGRLNTSIALFRIEQDNFAESTGQPIIGAPPDTVAYRAVQGAVTEGIELEAVGEISPRWQVMGGYTHRVTRGAGDAKINTTAPEDMLKLSTRYSFAERLQGLTIGAGLSWQSEIYEMVDRPGFESQVPYTQSSYTLVDLMARYAFSSRLSATFNASNALDEKYYNNIGFYNGGYYGDPRKYGVRVNFAF